jgi:excisionase family DNA binding protein
VSKTTNGLEAHPTFGPSRFVSPREAAYHLRHSPAWVYERIKTGELHAVKVGGVLRIPRETFEAWLSAITTSAA